MRWRVGIRAAMLAIVLAALGTVVAIQGRRIAALEEEVGKLQRRTAAYNKADVQFINQANRASQAYNKRFDKLTREIEELRAARAPEAAPR